MLIPPRTPRPDAVVKQGERPFAEQTSKRNDPDATGHHGVDPFQDFRRGEHDVSLSKDSTDARRLVQRCGHQAGLLNSHRTDGPFLASDSLQRRTY